MRSIIGLTAHIDKEKNQLGLNAGMNIVLTKPLLRENALYILRNFVFRQPPDNELLKGDLELREPLYEKLKEEIEALEPFLSREPSNN